MLLRVAGAKIQKLLRRTSHIRQALKQGRVICIWNERNEPSAFFYSVFITIPVSLLFRQFFRRHQRSQKSWNKNALVVKVN